MQVEDTALQADIKRVLESPGILPRYDFTGTLHTTANDHLVLKVVMIDVLRDYVNNIGDYTLIEIAIPLGVYIREIYPYRTNLEFTLNRKFIRESSTLQQKNTNNENERYKAIFLPTNPQPTGGEYDQYGDRELNLVKIVEFKLQLLNRSLEALRIIEVSGIFKNVSMKDLIYTLMGETVSKVRIDGKQVIDGVDFVEPNNQIPVKQIILGNGLRLQDLPTHLQERSKGIYNGGIGTYFQPYRNKKYWFIYPLFDTGRFTKKGRKAIFYSIPSIRYLLLNRTYRDDQDVIYILVTGEKSYQDSAETEYMNSGVGFRMVDAGAVLKKPVELTEQGPVANPSRLNYRVANKSRTDGLNYVPPSQNEVSGNPFVNYSQVLMREGSKVDLIWHHSNMEIIYPGMPCQYVYLEKGKIRKTDGVVLFCHHIFQMETKGLQCHSYITSSYITLFVKTLEKTNGI